MVEHETNELAGHLTARRGRSAVTTAVGKAEQMLAVHRGFWRKLLGDAIEAVLPAFDSTRTHQPALVPVRVRRISGS